MTLPLARVAATLPAQDLARAMRFYKEKLGLDPTDEEGGQPIYQLADGTRFTIFVSTGAPSGTHTQAGFEVEDIEEEVATLKGNGVVFEEYDSPGFKSVGGIVDTGTERGAWLKDSEGNLIGIFQPHTG